MEFENRSPGQLIQSIIVVLLTLLVATQALSLYIIQPMAYDGTLTRTGRYSLTFEAWDTIGINENETVVGIGTSLTQYGISGNCIEEKIEINNTSVYNLGVPGSLPYIEMMQTTTAIANNPSLILLEVNPINLFPLVYASSEYLEMRIKLNSLFMNSGDYGDWVELLREQDMTHLDGVFSNRYGSESTYFNSAINEYLTNLLTDERASKHWYLSTPHPSSNEWEDYLKNPVWLPRYLDSLNQSEVEDYENATIVKELKRPRYNPTVEMNLNKLALEYMVQEFSEHKIPVLLVSYPIHPTAKSHLIDNQFEPHNNTLEILSSYEGVSSLNMIWTDEWAHSDFYDIEHLDTSGREKLCSVLALEINQILN